MAVLAGMELIFKLSELQGLVPFVLLIPFLYLTPASLCNGL